MKRAITWMAGSALLLWLCWHFQVWHMLLQLVLVMVTFVWLLAGAWIASRQSRAPKPAAPAVTTATLMQQVDAERKQFVLRFGETAAQAAEAMNPQIWAQQAWQTIGRK